VTATAHSTAILAHVRCRRGYILPALNGKHYYGATYSRGDSGTDIRVNDSIENNARLQELAPELRSDFTQDSWARASVRAETPTHFPHVTQLAANVFCTLGHGSRGLLTAPYAAECLWQQFMQRL
jgi:tRNA 5-methylaminomethyl-2-thiouridine biosynthesis bifunctional protein